MRLKIFDLKRILNGKVIMTEPAVIFPEGLRALETYVVETGYEGRPDLIALKFYGDESHVDRLLKFNGISNPFSIEVGDELQIPNPINTFKAFVKPNRPSGETKKEKFIKQRRLTQKDEKRLEFLQKKASNLPNGSKQTLPPNMLKDGQTNSSVVGPDRTFNGPLATDSQQSDQNPTL